MSGIRNITELTEEQILAGLQNSDYEIFTFLYSTYFQNLSLASFKYVKDIFIAEEIVQDVFIRIWEEPSVLSLVHSLKPYLYRSVVNQSINYVNRQKNIERHHLRIAAERPEDCSIEALHEEQELKRLVYNEIERLPAQCKRVFKMSRFEGLKYKEIAQELNISENTVENHISNALKILRSRLLLQNKTENGNRFKYIAILSILSQSLFLADQVRNDL